MDLAAIAAVVSAACSLAQTLGLERGDDARPLAAADIAKPSTVPISDSEFAELTIALFNSYDPAELQAIYRRLAECRQQFMQTLEGQARQECICNVLRAVAAGNGGSLPDIDNWSETFKRLCLQSSERSTATHSM